MPYNRCSKCNSLLIEGERTCWNCAQKVSPGQKQVLDTGAVANFNFDSSQFGNKQNSPEPEKHLKDKDNTASTAKRNAMYDESPAYDEGSEQRRHILEIALVIAILGTGLVIGLFFL